MKKKQKLKKKRILILMIICILFIAGVGMFIYLKNNNIQKVPTQSKLEKLGYQDNERKLIYEKLSKEQIKILEKEKNKNKILLSLLEVKDFKQENLKRYHTYQKNNPQLTALEIITSVNENLDTYTPIYHKQLSSLVKEKCFIKNLIQRYLDYADKHTELAAKEIITNVNSNLDDTFYTNIKKTDMSQGNLIITNKYYQLENNYIPELVAIEGNYKATKDTTNAYVEMKAAAKKDGEAFRITSAYRSYQTQNNLYTRYKNQHGFAWAEKYSARPGHSEHQTGLALDIITNTSNLDTFENTSAFQWLKKNAYLYGFILRYPENKEYITGYSYEPWHYCYVGKETAKKIYEENITYEEYYEYYLNKK